MSAYIKSILSDREIVTKGFYSLILKLLGSLFGYPIVNLSDKFKTELRKKYRKLHDLLF